MEKEMSGSHEENASLSKGLSLSSSRSTKVSLEAIRSGKAGLDAHRQKMLDRVPETGDWAEFEVKLHRT